MGQSGWQASSVSMCFLTRSWSAVSPSVTRLKDQFSGARLDDDDDDVVAAVLAFSALHSRTGPGSAFLGLLKLP